jgi:hypothetical protein
LQPLGKRELILAQRDSSGAGDGGGAHQPSALIFASSSAWLIGFTI